MDNSQVSGFESSSSECKTSNCQVENPAEMNCCCNNKACLIGTFQSVLSVMRDSSWTPHAVDIFWRTSLLNKTVTPDMLTFPPLVENFVREASLPIKKNPNYQLFLNPEPFIPLCSLFSKGLNEVPPWGIKFDPQKPLSFCTLFRPGTVLTIITDPSMILVVKVGFFHLVFTDEGICHAFNAKHPKEILKESGYMRSFGEVFGEGNQIFEPFKMTGLRWKFSLFLFGNPRPIFAIFYRYWC